LSADPCRHRDQTLSRRCDRMPQKAQEAQKELFGFASVLSVCSVVGRSSCVRVLNGSVVLCVAGHRNDSGQDPNVRFGDPTHETTRRTCVSVDGQRLHVGPISLWPDMEVASATDRASIIGHSSSERCPATIPHPAFLLRRGLLIRSGEPQPPLRPSGLPLL